MTTMKKFPQSEAFALLCLIMLFVAACLLGGCALERADPAARSMRATYTLTATASGENSKVTCYITDGLIGTADGEGSTAQPSRQSAEQSPDVSVPGDALTAGIQTTGHIVGKVIDAKAAKGAASDGAASDDASADCPDGECREGDARGE